MNELVEPASFEALNSPALSINSVIKSESDEQMILRVAFQSPVKLKELTFRAAQPENGPRKVLVFANVASCPSFDDVVDMKAQATLELTIDQLRGAIPVPLRYVNFQNVRSIVLFVESNQSDSESTQIDQLVFWGSQEQSMDVSTRVECARHDHLPAGQQVEARSARSWRYRLKDGPGDIP